MEKKFTKIKSLLLSKKSEKEVIEAIISFGKDIENFPKDALTKDNLVQGCQSELYLTHSFKDGKIDFFIHSEALISKGLAAILIYLYSGEDPKALFTTPPTLFKEIPTLQKISLNRQIGIQNLFVQMQKIAARYL
ncbi:SufE family protein [bacterium]|nr:SufE family protein [bacterium]